MLKQAQKALFLLTFFWTMFLTAQVGPGGNDTTNLLLWLKADKDVTGTTSVTSWVDQSSNAFSATNVTSPSLVDGSVNYNPTINFNGSSQSLEIIDGIFGVNTYADIWVYIVQSTGVIQNSSIFFESLSSGERFGSHLPWGNSNIYFDFGACCGSSRINTNWGATTNTFNLWTMASSTGTATPSGTRKSIYRNGLSIATNNNNNTSNTRTGASNNFYIGSSNGSGSFSNTKIAEMIIYTEVPSDLEQQKIQSYLALKYGITQSFVNNLGSVVDGDYVLSDGTTKVWDYTANSVYHNDVAGIGLDNDSELNQKQSKSENTDAIVTIGLKGILETNNTNLNSFSTDKDFLVWGNNNGSTATQLTELPATAIATTRLGREWKVSENGSVDDLTITFDVAQTNIKNIELYIDTDGDANFTNATVITGGTIIDGKAFFSGVNLDDGDFFTLGYTVTTDVLGYLGPGGVGNTDGSSALVLWLNPDKGTNTGTSWTDQSGKGYNFTSGVGATFNTSDINGYNSYSFNGSSNYFEKSFESDLNSNAFSVFTVSNVTSSGLYKAIVSSRDDPAGTPTAGFILYAVPSTNNWSFWNGKTAGSWDTTGTTTSTTGSWASQNLFYENTTNGKRLFINNALNATSTHNLLANTIRPFRVGAGFNEGTPQYYFNGKIGEIIMFDVVLNSAQRIIINNYLSAKYNFALSSEDYFDEDTSGENFDHDVAGIGQATDGSNHTDSQGTGIIRINNPSLLASDDFLIWGRNNQTSYSFSTNTGSYTERISSNWRVSKRNDLGTVTFNIDLTDIDISGKQACSSLKLIVDNDSDLLSPTNTYTLTNIAGNIYRATEVDFSDNDYFTIEYVDQIVLDGATAYNGAGTLNKPNTDDDCYKMLVKTNTISLSENADVREIEIESGAILAVDSGFRLQVTNGINNSGDLRLVGSSQLVQIHTGTNLNTGSGNLFVDQTSSASSVYQSGYWTSPVTTNGSIFTIAGVLKDGSVPTAATVSVGEALDINFNGAFDGNAGTTPIEVSTRWLSKLIDAADWTRFLNPGTSTFIPGEGWNMKSLGATFTFKGIPNSGTYSIPISQDNFSLVGNPYPSALDSEAFITDNLSAINGTLYLYNGASDGTHDRNAYTGTYSTIVSGVTIGGGRYIPIGQAFFVTRDAAGSGTILFQNTQRPIINISDTAPILARTNQKRIIEKDFKKETIFPVLRLGFETDVNANFTYKRQLAVAFRGLTAAYENGYDGEMFDKKPSDLGLKVIDREYPFVISSIEDFNEDIEIPLHLEIDANREVKFKIDEFIGFEAVTVFLNDKVTNTFYKLSQETISLDLEQGIYSDRFFVTFKKSTLGADDSLLANGFKIYNKRETKELFIQNNSTSNIEKVIIYNLLGQKLIEVDDALQLNKKEILIKTNVLRNSIYIVTIKTKEGKISKKFY